MFAGKPIIGLVGGIGSGKSSVAREFSNLGCCVIDSDAQVRAAYNDSAIQHQIREWWGDAVFNSDGSINRRAIAQQIFADEMQRKRLESLLHPWVNHQRELAMQQKAADPQVVAFVWDTPLLIEGGLDRLCDALVFVDAPAAVRLQRVQQSRGWDEAELTRREILQLALDKKRKISQYVVDNTADAEYARGQVREVLSRILANR